MDEGSQYSECTHLQDERITGLLFCLDLVILCIDRTYASQLGYFQEENKFFFSDHLKGKQ